MYPEDGLQPFYAIKFWSKVMVKLRSQSKILFKVINDTTELLKNINDKSHLLFCPFPLEIAKPFVSTKRSVIVVFHSNAEERANCFTNLFSC